MALLLRRRGIHRVRPLAGGFDGWRSAGFPLETRALPTTDAPTIEEAPEG